MKRLLLAALAVALVAAPAALDAQDSTAGRGGRGRGGGRGTADPRDAGGGQCTANPWNCVDAANPIAARNTVWMEEMTWMDVRDAIRAGKTTAIIVTGGMEPNGPWLVTGKHNYVVHANCEAIARKLGNALCAPIVKFVPEGNTDPPTGHMRSPGTISMREETFRALLADIVASLRMHGFTQVFLLGDSGGNQAGQRAVADSLNALWGGNPLVAHVQEYYTYAVVGDHMAKNGLKDACREQLHDDPVIALNMFIDDPRSIKYDERVKAGKAKINGVDLSDHAKATALARQIVDFRAQYTVDAMHRTIANRGTLPQPQPQRGGGRAGAAAGGEAALPAQLPVCAYTGK